MSQRQRAAASSRVGTLIVLMLAGCGVGLAQSAATRPVPSIIPAPRELAYGAGSFTVATDTRVIFAAGSQGEQVARYFTELLQRTRGLALSVSSSSGSAAISFELLACVNADNEEGYSLVVSPVVSPGRIVVSACSPRGLFYGAVTLWQLITAYTSDGKTISIPAMTIVDAPRFRWRGLMVDSARHYQSPQFIKQLIDVMALHKLNVLHWHLTDDQAWRLEIKKYPRLTSVGAWRVPAGPAAAADIDPVTGKPRQYGGFYSQDQVREIVAYAAARYITIVPEIDMPGHASAAIAAYPQLGVIQPGANYHPPRRVPADWGIYSNLFNVEESTFEFLQDVLGEVLTLFPGEYVHVGGDEAGKGQWQASPRIQARMREFGVKDEHALQSYFIQRMGKLLNAQGRRLIGWDEILEGGLGPNATVMSWRGIDGAVAAAAAGHDAVLTPGPTLYFDNRPLATSSPPGRGKVISVEDVYRFDPAPAALDEQQRKHILGVQANVWTEHIRTEDRFEYMTFPRAAALAEVAWSPAERLDWASFSERLPAQLARYEALGIRYASNPSTGSPAMTAQHAGRRTSHELSTCSEKLVLSLEDDAPVRGERAIFLVDLMNPCWIYKDADLSAVTAIAASVGQVPFNFQIGDAVNKIPLRKPHSPAGELEVRVDGCEGKLVAALPLAPAVANYAVTRLPPAPIASNPGKHDLCFMFTQAGVDPTWVIDAVELVGTTR
jgi:hexosaminidase